VQPGNIVGAIANEAGIDSAHIGRIGIFDDYSTVDLPGGMPPEIFEHLKNTWVCGRKLAISVEGEGGAKPAPVAPRAKLTIGKPAHGKVPPGKLPPGRLPPGKLPPGRPPPGKLPPGKLPPGKLPPGKLPPGKPLAGPPTADKPPNRKARRAAAREAKK
jgi:hypothetical protein